MKKSLVLLAGIVLFGISCNKSTNHEDELNQNEEVTATHRNCAADDVLQIQLKEDPTLGARMNAIEDFTRQVQENPLQYRLVNGVVEIPVVFNVLYKTTAENISQAQLQSQIDVLNEDFSATNADYNLTSTYNSVKAGNIAVRFVLDQVVRRSTTTTSWSYKQCHEKKCERNCSNESDYKTEHLGL